MALNHWALAGDWTIGRQATSPNKAGGRIVYRFYARDLHLVMGAAAPGTSVRYRVRIDSQGNGTVTEPRLYQLIRQPKPIVERQFEIEFLDPGVQVFSFTFG